jgi:RNA-directed DNA polymerase
MSCRGLQALHLLALGPVAETVSDKNSYGFRPKRSCADAIEQCFNIFSRKTSSKYALEGDIKSCFDKISHEWLLEHIPMDKVILKKWLKCGYVESGTLFPTNEGTPQGGLISTTLLNLTMKGLEEKIASITKQSDQVNLVVYACVIMALRYKSQGLNL